MEKEPLTLDEIVESLYDLTKQDLRVLALQCLLISDGPDQVTETENDE